MSAAEAFKNAMAELRQEQASAIQQHRADSKALADLTTKLNAALQGQITDVDVVALAAEIHQAAVDLHAGLSDTHSTAVDAKPAAATTSDVQGGSTAGPDVVSASSPGVIKPEATPDESSQAVPSTLGGGAMPAREPTIAERAPGAPVPDGKGGETVASPAVPSVEDVPSDVHDNAPDSAKKG